MFASGSAVPSDMVASLEVADEPHDARRPASRYGMQWGASLYLYPIEENLVEVYHCPPTPNQVNEARMYGGRWSQHARTRLPNVVPQHLDQCCKLPGRDAKVCAARAREIS
jgi:hypothetical protein